MIRWQRDHTREKRLKSEEIHRVRAEAVRNTNSVAVGLQINDEQRKGSRA